MKKILLAVSCLALMFSCSKQNTPEPNGESPYIEKKGVETFSYTYEMAEELAMRAPSFFAAENTKSVEKSIAKGEVVLSDNLTKSGGAADTLMYVFNYAGDEGYVVISKDDSKGGILAYVENGSLSVNEPGELNSYLLDRMKSYCESDYKIEIQSKAADDYEYSYKKYANTFLFVAGPNCQNVRSASTYPLYDESVPVIAPEQDTPFRQNGCIANLHYEKFGVGVDPLLGTSWGQGYPFNLKAPLSYGENMLAGAEATAFVQLLIYLQKPEYYPQGSIAGGVDVSGRATEISKLGKYRYGNASGTGNGPGFRDHVSTLYNVVGNKFQNSWSPSYTFARGNIGTVLRFFGFDHQILTYPYALAEVIESININRPVYAIGTNMDSAGNPKHAWIFDGWRQLYKGYTPFYFNPDGSLAAKGNDTYLDLAWLYYLNCNFGFDGHSNGYYLNEVFDTDRCLVETKTDFSNNIMITPRIY